MLEPNKSKTRRISIKKSILVSVFIALLILFPICTYAENSTIGYTPNITFEYKQENQEVLDNIPNIGCKAAYIAEPITGKVIYEKNAHEPMYPASTTKILTALVVMENCQLDEKAIVSKRAIDLVPSGYSNAKLQVGEELTVQDLLYALLIPSANEAANVLAEHVNGSVEAFVELCNNRAKELGCENLHFVNTNGMHDENHYCSAYDLYLIAKECRKYDIFNEIVKTKNFTLPATEVYPRNDRTFQNTNELLLSGTYYYPYCTGIKTGHTTPAGECLVASSSYNNLDLISVVLGGQLKNSQGLNDRFYDTKQLFEFTYNNYSVKEIAEYGHAVATLTVGRATKETATLDAVVDADISTIVLNSIDKDNVQSSISIDDDIIAPIKQNQVLGQITYYADGLEYTTNIVASHSVEKLPYYKYNSIVIGDIIFTIIIIILLLIIFKKKKKTAVIAIFIILILEGFCIYAALKESAARSITKVKLIQNPAATEQADIDEMEE